jgi:hypothetical protein
VRLEREGHTEGAEKEGNNREKHRDVAKADKLEYIEDEVSNEGHQENGNDGQDAHN